MATGTTLWHLIGVAAETALWYWLGIQLAYWAILFVGIYRFDRCRMRVGGLDGLPPIRFQIVIPIFNEDCHLAMIATTLESARAIGLQSIVVDDGSCDGSTGRLLELCQRAGAGFLRHPANRGKAVALQTGLQVVTTQAVLLVDADTSVPLDLAFNVGLPPTVGAAAFTIVPIESGALAAAQAREYEYILNFEREALSGFGLVLTVPGAASLWRTDALRDIGGFSARTQAEDTDATIALQLAGWKAIVCPIIANTVCPATLRSLVRQRSRWIWGNLQAACYAIRGIFGDKRVVTRRPAIALASVSLFNLAGYAVTTTVVVRLAVLQVGLVDLIAAVLLSLATVARVCFTRRLRPMSDRRLPEILGSLLLMQAINFVGFWHGAVLRSFRRSPW